MMCAVDVHSVDAGFQACDDRMSDRSHCACPNRIYENLRKPYSKKSSLVAEEPRGGHRPLQMLYQPAAPGPTFEVVCFSSFPTISS